MWEIRYGDPAVPKKEWTIYQPYIADPKAGAATVRAWNEEQARTERYNRDRPNSWVSYRRTDHFRYTLMKIPVERDFAAREQARTDEPVRFPKEFSDRLETFLWAEIIPPNKVQCYRTLSDAWEGKRTEMRLGKFLTEFARFINNDDISQMCALMGIEVGDAVLKFAESREDIRRVYEEGPRSCMSKRASHFSYAGDDVHPCEAYASEDIMVAYLERDGDITARAVVNRHTKEYLSAYGDEIRLVALLDKQGFTHSENAIGGCRLLYIQSQAGEALYLPYLDGYNNQVDVEVETRTVRVRKASRTFTPGTQGMILL